MATKAYGVPTRNQFSQLDSDVESEHEAPKPTVAKPTVAKPSRSSPAAVEMPREVRSPGDERTVRGGRGGGGAARRSRGGPLRGSGRGAAGGRGGPTSFGAPAPTPFSADDEDEAIFPEGRVNTRPRGGRRFERDGREGREGRGARGSAPYRGREFDRQSGTGRGREMKRSGAGVYNWGTAETEVAEAAPVAEGETSELEGQGAGEVTREEGAGQERKPRQPEDHTIPFAEYQKAQKQKRAQLLQEKAVGGGAVRAVDSTELEKDGYQRYEREETVEERAAREARLQADVSSESEDEDETRPKTYNIFEFTNEYRSSGRGRRGGRGGRTDDRTAEGGAPYTMPSPVNLNLQDAAAFPSLM